MASTTQDIALSEDYDLFIEGGDFVVADSLLQHFQLILSTKQGDWKDSPLLGVNYKETKNATNGEDMILKIKKNFAIDGIKVRKLIIDKDNIDIDADY